MKPPRALTRKAEGLLDRWGLSYEHLLGIRFAINAFIATTIVWFTLRALGVGNPIWAIASMVAAADPEPVEARRMFRSRLVNVLVGCAVGFGALLVGDGSDWLIPFTLALTVLISSYIVRVKTMWRQAPITAAIVLATGISQGAKSAGVESGLRKVGQVIFGCLVGMLVSYFMSKVWLVRPPSGREECDEEATTQPTSG
ncbi:MAG: hypothetical protein DMF63_02590 [Acidobacteria bacterium]|nr:MAG: hypothetical protein DMF63_02590 [Acidobacteriota bacterium]